MLGRTAAIGRSIPPQGGVLPKLQGVSSPEMDQIEKEFQDITNDRGKLSKLWNRLDYNGMFLEPFVQHFHEAPILDPRQQEMELFP